MRYVLLGTFLLLIHPFGRAQSVVIKYYSKENLSREVPKEKAKFSRTITQNTDGSVTTELKDMKDGEVINSETWKEKEPYGIWKIQTGKGIEEMDYNFPLVYSNGDCIDSTIIYNANSPPGQTPILDSGDSTIMRFLIKNVRYPSFARENGIEGRVIVQFIITESGAVEDVSVIRSVQTTLDKEAVRVVRKMKFLVPAANDQLRRICMKLPITFRLG